MFLPKITDKRPLQEMDEISFLAELINLNEEFHNTKTKLMVINHYEVKNQYLLTEDENPENIKAPVNENKKGLIEKIKEFFIAIFKKISFFILTQIEKIRQWLQYDKKQLDYYKKRRNEVDLADKVGIEDFKLTDILGILKKDEIKEFIPQIFKEQKTKADCDHLIEEMNSELKKIESRQNNITFMHYDKCIHTLEFIDGILNNFASESNKMKNDIKSSCDEIVKLTMVEFKENSEMHVSTCQHLMNRYLQYVSHVISFFISKCIKIRSSIYAELNNFLKQSSTKRSGK